MVFGRKTTKRFSATIPPGETETFTESIAEPATAENVTIRFYPGNELTLSVYPFRERESDMLPLVDTIGDSDIVGDDDRFDFDITEQINTGDSVGVQVENSGDYSYRFVCDIDIDYQGGGNRIADWLGERL